MSVELITLPDIPLVEEGDDLVEMICDGLDRLGLTPRDGDIFVLAQKIVSKSEGRLVDLSTVHPSAKAHEVAVKTGKDPRLVELILSESAAIVAARPDLLLVEHRLGFVMPAAGIDKSNIGPKEHDKALLLPVDPDLSAEEIRMWLSAKFRVRRIGVIINDSVSRAWRMGTCGVAIGCAGMPVVNDLRGMADMYGRELKVSITGFVDEVAAAASLVMGQADERTPIVLVRGLNWNGSGKTADIVTRPSVVTPEKVEHLRHA